MEERELSKNKFKYELKAAGIIKSHNHLKIISPEDVKKLSAVNYAPMFKKAMEYVNQLLLAHFADRADQSKLKLYLSHEEYSIKVIAAVIEEVKKAGWRIESDEIRPNDHWVTRATIIIPRKHLVLTEKQEKELDEAIEFRRAWLIARAGGREKFLESMGGKEEFIEKFGKDEYEEIFEDGEKVQDEE